MGCGAVRCGAARRGAVRCGSIRCGAVRWTAGGRCGLLLRQESGVVAGVEHPKPVRARQQLHTAAPCCGGVER